MKRKILWNENDIDIYLKIIIKQSRHENFSFYDGNAKLINRLRTPFQGVVKLLSIRFFKEL